MSVDDGADKDDGRQAGQGVQQVDEVQVFVLEGDEEVVLQQGRDGLVFPRDFEFNRVAQGRALQFRDFGRHRCREEVRPTTFARDHFEDLVDHGPKVEVEQSVCLVEYLRGWVVKGQSRCRSRREGVQRLAIRETLEDGP